MSNQYEVLGKAPTADDLKKLSPNEIHLTIKNLNAGYGTRDHINAIRKYGVTRFHRKTFNPIHNILSPK